MEILYSSVQYVQELLKVAKNYSTYYAWGAFGAPANEKNKARYKVPKANANDFLFDCSGFAYRALPWGWCGDHSRVYGGAKYPVKGDDLYPLTTGNICSICTDVSKDFSMIQEGEVLYMTGHVAIYIGAGMAVECTSKWTNGCLISEVTNCGINTGLPYKRKWLKHAKLPFVQYAEEPKEPIRYAVQKGDTLTKIAKKFNTTVAKLVEVNKISNPNRIIVGQVLTIV